MANTFPLSKKQTQFTGKSPSAVTDDSEGYKNMLGFQAAGEDVGLFYQLNRSAAAVTSDTYEPDGVRSRPVEANSAYA